MTANIAGRNTGPDTAESVYDDFAYPVLKEPNKPDPFYDLMGPRWDKLATVMAGTQAMRDAGEKYTPKFEGESTEAYQNRLAKTDLTNVLQDSVDNAVAKPFSKEMVLDSDENATNPKLLEWAKDMDLEGNNLHDFGKLVFEHGLTYAWSYILVDYPNIEGRVLSLAAQEAEGIRPYCVFLTAQSVISYRTAKVHRHTVPVYLRYRSDDYDYKPDGTPVQVRRVHEIRASRDATPTQEAIQGYFRVYESRDSGDWKVVSAGPYMFDAVTVVKNNFGKERKIGGGDTPFFMDLCEKNIAHWNSTSDQSNILTRTRFAIYHFKGLDLPVDDDGAVIPVTFGPDTVLTSPAEGNSEVQTVTLPTSGIEQGWVDLDRKESDMRLMGLDPLASGKGGSSTATERNLDDKKSNSALESWAIQFAGNMERVFKYMALWGGLGGGDIRVKAIINTRFGVTNKDINEVKMLQDMQTMGQLSLDTLLNEAKRRQMFSPEFDVEDEIAKIGSERGDVLDYDLNIDEPAHPKKTKKSDKLSTMKEGVETPVAA